MCNRACLHNKSMNFKVRIFSFFITIDLLPQHLIAGFLVFFSMHVASLQHKQGELLPSLVQIQAISSSTTKHLVSMQKHQ